MSQSPDASQKQKKKQKKNKQRALKDFLQAQKTETLTASEIASTNLSDHEEKVERIQQKFCTICETDLGDKIRNCGFCNFVFCSEHMRKKRKNKQANKFVRICDNCQDRYLYSKYMKLEVKNQESIAVQQTIIEAAKDQIESKVFEKRQIMQKHRKKREEIQQERKQYQKKWQQQELELKNKNEGLQNKQRQLENMQQNIKQLQAKMAPDLQQDYRTLQIQSQRVHKQISKYEKLCSQASSTKSRRQKQIYEQYSKWQQKQRVKLTQKQQQDCCIF